MSTVDLPVNLLRAFITVSDLGGYTKAAKVLHRTQSAISLQMKRLEELLGEKLLVHEGGTVNLTSYGKVLAGFARQILQLNDEAVARYRKTNVRGPLRIGLPINSIMLSLSSTTRPGSIWSVPGRNSRSGQLHQRQLCTRRNPCRWSHTLRVALTGPALLKPSTVRAGNGACPIAVRALQVFRMQCLAD